MANKKNSRNSQKVRIPINTLSGGVTRRPSSKARADQARNLENCMITLERSLEKRNGTQYISGDNLDIGGFPASGMAFSNGITQNGIGAGSLNLGDPTLFSSDDLFVDWIDLDEDNKYLVFINTSLNISDDEVINIFKITEGINKEDIFSKETVNLPSDATEKADLLTYLRYNPSSFKDLKLAHFGSGVFVLNKLVPAGVRDEWDRNIDGSKRLIFDGIVSLSLVINGTHTGFKSGEYLIDNQLADPYGTGAFRADLGITGFINDQTSVWSDTNADTFGDGESALYATNQTVLISKQGSGYATGEGVWVGGTTPATGTQVGTITAPTGTIESVIIDTTTFDQIADAAPGPWTGHQSLLVSTAGGTGALITAKVTGVISAVTLSSAGSGYGISADVNGNTPSFAVSGQGTFNSDNLTDANKLSKGLVGARPANTTDFAWTVDESDVNLIADDKGKTITYRIANLPTDLIKPINQIYFNTPLNDITSPKIVAATQRSVMDVLNDTSAPSPTDAPNKKFTIKRGSRVGVVDLSANISGPWSFPSSTATETLEDIRNIVLAATDDLNLSLNADIGFNEAHNGIIIVDKDDPSIPLIVEPSVSLKSSSWVFTAGAPDPQIWHNLQPTQNPAVAFDWAITNHTMLNDNVPADRSIITSVGFGSLGLISAVYPNGSWTLPLPIGLTVDDYGTWLAGTLNFNSNNSWHQAFPVSALGRLKFSYDSVTKTFLVESKEGYDDNWEMTGTFTFSTSSLTNNGWSVVKQADGTTEPDAMAEYLGLTSPGGQNLNPLDSNARGIGGVEVQKLLQPDPDLVDANGQPKADFGKPRVTVNTEATETVDLRSGLFGSGFGSFEIYDIDTDVTIGLVDLRELSYAPDLALLDKYEAIPTGDADDTGGSPRLLATNNSAQYAVGDLWTFADSSNALASHRPITLTDFVMLSLGTVTRDGNGDISEMEVTAESHKYEVVLNTAKSSLQVMKNKTQIMGVRTISGGLATELGFAFSEEAFLPVDENVSVQPLPHLAPTGQSVESFEFLQTQPLGDDRNSRNGSEGTLSLLYHQGKYKISKGNIQGFGKVWKTRQAYLTFTPGYFRTIDNSDKEGGDGRPKFLKVRDQDTNSVWDERTMPMLLDLDTINNEWTIGTAPWEPRKSGDSSVNPGPSAFTVSSFNERVRRPIRSLSFFRNRLFLGVDDILFSSRIGSFFDFFLDDPANITDKDPIDVRASSGEFTYIASMQPFNDFMFINTTGATQYELIGSPSTGITPTTADLAPTSFYTADTFIDPIILGSQIYFFGPERLYVYFSDSRFSIADTVEVSDHVFGYLPVSLRDTAVFPEDDMLFMVDDAAKSDIYLYWNRYSGDRVIQNSFARWNLFRGTDSIWDSYTIPASAPAHTSFDKGRAKIVGAHVIGRYLYMVVQRPNTLSRYTNAGSTLYPEFYYMEKIELVPGTWDFKAPAGLIEHPINNDPTPKLDRWVLVPGIYDSATNTTTFTLPHNDPYATKAFFPQTWPTEGGGELTITNNEETSGPTTCTAVGKWDTDEDGVSRVVAIGQPFLAVAELPTVFLRDQQANVIDGTVNLKSLTVRHWKTGAYDITVSNKGRTPRKYTYIPGLLSGALSLGENKGIDEEGEFFAPVLGYSDDVVVKIESPYAGPMQISNIEFKGNFVPTYSALQQ